MTEPQPVEWWGAGIYPDMPAETYHSDPVPDGSLSSGGARKLLPPSCPAKFKHWLDHDEPASRVCEFGNAAHLVALGVGTPVAVLEHDGRTKAGRAELAEARAAGLTPVKAEDWDHIQAMATALRSDPVAAPFFEPGSGTAEQSLFWEDQRHEIWRRARLDWVPTWFYPDGKLVIPDYKTAKSADPVKLQRTMVDYGYDQQAAWYVDAARALGLAPAGARFVFVFQEKEPPYVVSVVEPDELVVERGRARNAWAMSVYAECRATGRWPGYVEGIGRLDLPRWVESEFLDEVQHGFYEPFEKGEKVRDDT